MAGEKKSKKNLIIGIIAALLIFGAIGSCTGGSKSSSSSSEEESSSSVTTEQSASNAKQEERVASSELAEASESEVSVIKLVSSEMGEYGQEMVWNAGTESEEKKIVFYVPSGSYTAKNVGTNTTQMGVEEGVQVNEDGWEEPANIGDILVLKPGDSGDLSVPDGWFIELTDSAQIELTPKA